MSYKELKGFHDQYWSIYTSVTNIVSEIWPPHFSNVSQSNNNVQEIADLENFQHLGKLQIISIWCFVTFHRFVDMEYRKPPDAPIQKPMSLFKAP